MYILYQEADGKLTINPKNTFVYYFNMHFSIEKCITEMLSEIKKLVYIEAKKLGGEVRDGAINKCNGDWYEWIISLRSIYFCLNNHTQKILVSMPNNRSFDCTTLYKKELSWYIYDLRHKLEENHVNLVTSNPDFFIVDTKNCPYHLKKNLDEYYNKFRNEFKNGITISTIERADHLYNIFINQLELDDIYAYLSVKTTLRPDRRLQLAHEGSLMKALYVHLQTRTWNINAKGIKYYGAATKLSDADVDGLKTAATHSIAAATSNPQSAVDKLFKLDSFYDIDQCLSEILVKGS